MAHRNGHHAASVAVSQSNTAVTQPNVNIFTAIDTDPEVLVGSLDMFVHGLDQPEFSHEQVAEVTTSPCHWLYHNNLAHRSSTVLTLVLRTT